MIELLESTPDLRKDIGIDIIGTHYIHRGLKLDVTFLLVRIDAIVRLLLSKHAELL